MTRQAGLTWAAMASRRSGKARRLAARAQVADPFALLGLASDADLTDDEVRAAWRRIAAATHPDRADGGDPERFAEVANAYTELRTRSGRGEAAAAIADAAALGRTGTGGPLDRRIPAIHAGPAARLLTRVRLGRPVRLLVRVLAAAGAGAAGYVAAGPGPAGPALITGALTWLVLTARRDLHPP